MMESPFVTNDHIQTFQRDGAISLRQVFDEQWQEAVARGIDRNLETPSPYFEFLKGDQGCGRFFNDYCNWQQIDEYHRYVYQSPAGEIAGRLMQSDQAIFYHEHVLIKEPGTTKPSPWHPDQPYYPIDGRQICSIWMPLDPVPLETSLKFVRGSHAWGRTFFPRKFSTALNYQLEDSSREGESASFETVPDIDGEPDRYQILCWPLEPGDCVVFHGMTLHGAAGNVSLTTSRRVLSTRWVGDDARFAQRLWNTSPPISGGLEPGDPMACETFPVVWSRS